MANGIIDINFTNLDSCASRIAQEIELLQTKINEIKNCDSSIDSRVKNQLGASFDTTELETIKTRLEKTQTFLGEVKKVYTGADIDLSNSLSVDYLEYLYPNFKSLSDDRKAIVLSALRYLGLRANQMGYAKNFSSQYASSQFIGDATEHAWCAMFVGSIINYYYGNESIIDPSYASVWKIIGNYGNQTGIAFEEDDRIHYYVSQALVDKYKQKGGFSNWETNLSKYNAEHGTNLKVSDWVKDGYVPQPGDIVTFKQGNIYFTSKKDAPLADYNEAVDKSRAAFFADTKYSDYPDDPQSYTHIGFVLGTREVDGVTYVDTVEGNVNDDVEVRSFRIDDPYLVGYGHIDYEKFASDKAAIQNMVATGVDTQGSHATAATMSQHLLALHKGDLKGNYLVNLASNLDKVGAENLVVKDPNITGQITTIGTTQDNPVVTTTQQTTQPQTNPQQTTYQQTTTTTTTTSGGGTTHYQTPSYSQPTYQEPVQTTTEVSVPSLATVSPTVEPVREVVSAPQVVSTVAAPAETPTVVVQEPAPSYVSIPQEESPTPVVAQIVEDYKTPDLPVMLEEVPVDEEFTYEISFDDSIDSEPIDIPDSTEMTIPEGVVTYENVNKPAPTSSQKKGFPFGTVALTTLGVGAAAGGAYYMARKAKQNNDTGEEDEEESEEEYSYEY